MWWNSAGRGSQGDHQDALRSRDIKTRGSCRLGSVPPRASVSDAGFVQRFQRLFKPRLSPIHHMVVGQAAAIDPGRFETTDVLRVHVVMNRLAGPGLSARGDRGFEVDQFEIGCGLPQFCQRVAPDVVEGRRPGDFPEARSAKSTYSRAS